MFSQLQAMKVLQLCHKMPFPVKDGGAFSIHNTALGLAHQGVDLTVMAVNTPKDWVDPASIPLEFSRKVNFEWSEINTCIRPFKIFTNIFSNKSYFVERFWSESWNNHLIRILHENDFDIVQLEHLYMGLYLSTIRSHSKAKIILRPQNVEAMVWRRCISCMKNPVKKNYLKIATSRLAKFEKNLAGNVDGIIAISPGDAEVFGKLAPGIPVISIPLGYDERLCRNIIDHNDYEETPVFYHLGSMDWLPNEQGIKWFIEHVMPLLKNDLPWFRFRIAGKNMPGWIKDINNNHIVVDGEVEDACLYHKDKMVMIVPLLSGGGIRAKIIEAMALGKVVISTGIGAEGIPCTNDTDILIADTSEEFVQQIARCSESADLRRKIGLNARKLVEKKFDCRFTAQNMIQFYNMIDPPEIRGY